MANRNYTPVQFTLEKNLVILAAQIVFNGTGSASVASLVTNNSKGICAFASESVPFTGSISSATFTIGTASSFAGLYAGMTLACASSDALLASTRIASTGVLGVNMDKAPFTSMVGSSDGVSFQASGGRYRVQFGTQAGTRLDAYNKLLKVTATWDMTTSSSVGTATTVAQAPQSPLVFIVDNRVGIRTIGSGSAAVINAAGSTDCSLALQLGYVISSGVGTALTQVFRAAVPQAGDTLRLVFKLSNSTAP